MTGVDWWMLWLGGVWFAMNADASGFASAAEFADDELDELEEADDEVTGLLRCTMVGFISDWLPLLLS